MTVSSYRLSGVVSLLVFVCAGLMSQTNISGTINQYSAVSAVDYPGNSVTVADPGFFAVGDQVLLIQMQGATIDETNTSSFGDVSSYGGAGNYELAIVCDVTGSVVVLENNLVHVDYDPTGQLQLITVPVYNDATVNAELTGQAWDGTTGGVVAVLARNILTLDAPINMDGKGFRGGVFENAISTCDFFFQVTDYFYDTPNDGGGKKGESISPYISAKEYGRGAQAAGGGGGNDHNSGGGGGANAGAGGVGGEDISTGFFNCDGEFPGEGGKVPTLTSNRIFPGSGGGAGDGNNNIGTSGGNGGGIVLVFTKTLVIGASGSISANGLDAANTTGGDGAGGGGAGGSIYLEAAAVSGTPVLSVVGGKGGDVDNSNANRCFGPGGGGGGGLIRTNLTLAPTSLVVDGGIAGESLNTSATGCTGSTGSAAGGTGLVLSDVAPSGTSLSLACSALPVSWQDIQLELRDKTTLLSWSVSDQEDNDYFTIERSDDGSNFQELGRAAATEATAYTYTDREPLEGNSFYRVRQTDFDGQFSFSPVVNSHRAYTEIRLYPSPAKAGEIVKLELPEALQNGNVTVSLLDQNGREIWRKRTVGDALQPLETSGLPEGLYLVNLRNERVNWTGRLVVVR
ncbi:MAG: T9SS type A sorting domain-containing protein [Lewinella sp.]